MASARVAFEHALTAQWVLLTEAGETRLKASFDQSDYRRREGLISGVRAIGNTDDSFAELAHGLSDEELDSLVGDAPHETGVPNIDAICRRFAGGGAEYLLYDIFRELSGAVHPSLALVRTHLRLPDGKVTGFDTFERCNSDNMLGRELAISALWALYAAEVCRSGQPRAAQVAALGAGAQLPVDLQASDQQPGQQPTDETAYWCTQ
ncbi:hypothetical protein [Mycobacterium sp. 1245499.0]|uniref:hypothetical protein n=1 Tax=Mycobacterium sp. 1245499.0 TaxID=1834074 RepID=UPI0012E99424|nr:hypothetical protein [Mycobacterium sp. 1245499.0]